MMPRREEKRRMKLIASWGSSGAGKTTIALAVAAELTRRRKDVLVMGMDTRTPMLPVYLPDAKLTPHNSLGAVFEQDINEGALKDKMVPHPQSDRLYFMGLVSGEVAGITYRIPDRTAVQTLINVLRQSPFAYCIVDCGNPVMEPITLLALELADVVLRTITPDVRGYEGMKAKLRWLSNSDDTFRTERHLKILNPVYSYTPLAEMEALMGDPEVIALPWSGQVAERQLAGRLLTGFDQPEATRFASKIKDIVDRIEGGYYG